MYIVICKVRINCYVWVEGEEHACFIAWPPNVGSVLFHLFLKHILIHGLAFLWLCPTPLWVQRVIGWGEAKAKNRSFYMHLLPLSKRMSYAVSHLGDFFSYGYGYMISHSELLTLILLLDYIYSFHIYGLWS